jgi:hypothetical protein
MNKHTLTSNTLILESLVVAMNILEFKNSIPVTFFPVLEKDLKVDYLVLTVFKSLSFSQVES